MLEVSYRNEKTALETFTTTNVAWTNRSFLINTYHIKALNELYLVFK